MNKIYMHLAGIMLSLIVLALTFFLAISPQLERTSNIKKDIEEQININHLAEVRGEKLRADAEHKDAFLDKAQIAETIISDKRDIASIQETIVEAIKPLGKDIILQTFTPGSVSQYKPPVSEEFSIKNVFSQEDLSAEDEVIASNKDVPSQEAPLKKVTFQATFSASSFDDIARILDTIEHIGWKKQGRQILVTGFESNVSAEKLTSTYSVTVYALAFTTEKLAQKEKIESV